jgi:hypothetical protein
VQKSVTQIANYLRSIGLNVIFCAADGVAAYTDSIDINIYQIYEQISIFSERKLTFSAGVGASLRESYFALAFAKSSGKARIYDFKDMN